MDNENIEIVPAPTTVDSVIYFRSSSTGLSQTTLDNISTTHGHDISICTESEELAKHLLKTGNLLVLVDVETFAETSITPIELKNMIGTMQKFSGKDSRIEVAVVVEKSCGVSFIRDLQSCEMIGLVPACVRFGSEETSEALASLMKFETYWPQHIIDVLTNIPEKRKKPRIESSLTTRQLQILKLIQNRGLSNKAIAQMLNIAESTVKVHVGALLKTFGVRNRTQLAVVSTYRKKA